MVYRHILVAVELDSECDDVPSQRAFELSKQFGAKLTVVHAVEHMSSYGAAYGIAAGADIEEMLLENAREAMAKIGQKMGLADNQQIIKIGPAKLVVLEEAEKLGVDLIIVGSHGRHGVRLLLGSTANAVLHGAKCDVLAVRIKNE
ncbi:MAG: universal stress protein [Gammaproteobacteria bacterium]